MNKNYPRICFVSTIAWPLRVYIGPHIRKITKSGHVTLVASGVSELQDNNYKDSIILKEMLISRRISLLIDAIALYKLWQFFRTNHFDCVHSIMPKAGLLAMLAAAASGVPMRFHSFTGQVWVTRKGLSRRFLMLMDWLIARLATHVLADAPSQRKFLIAKRIVRAEKIEVLGLGSIVGVDTMRFAPNSVARSDVRAELGIGISDFVFIFVGRLNPDKGVADLLQAFERIAVSNSGVHLLLIGPDEGDYDAHIASIDDTLKKKIHRVGFTAKPELYMAGADVICLPSCREGFGSVLIEAAAVEVPAIASRIYGVTDAIIDGVTGVLHEPRNVSEIAELMLRLMRDETLRLRLGAAARARVIEHFSEERLTSAFESFYRQHGVI